MDFYFYFSGFPAFTISIGFKFSLSLELIFGVSISVKTSKADGFDFELKPYFEIGFSIGVDAITQEGITMG